ncbi:MAG: type III-B CRISPR-associated protein Cas10/Cmr2 [Planctomycetes bacterium]|nr:type III-B CRISPR-associated protein Cas10/Cmr2 [Planctomycetota bacterium]
MSFRLDLSIGPVQGFVAQSRRTRDLWGSSYLLSFLAAHAMVGAQRAGGTIVQPRVADDPLFHWASGQREGSAPAIGSLPNHFVVEVESDPKGVAGAAILAMRAAWDRVCEAVWVRFVAPAVSGSATRGIWERQVQAFWELTWTAGDSAQHGLLARRKHWRSHRLPDEPGDKCSVMDELQELSGHVRATSRPERDAQDEFWRRVGSGMGLLDLRDGERLCAIAFVKRMFPKVAEAALGWRLDTAHWPSTVYVGAVPWIRRATRAAPAEARAYGDAVRRHAEGALAERQPNFDGLKGATTGEFSRLDANYFHSEFVTNERLCPLGASSDGVREGLRQLLAKVHAKVGAPPAFYGLLLADGDRLGKLIGTLGRESVGRALFKFTSDVPGVVRAHDGVTVYAGGDDVLAILPAARALPCSAALAESYAAAFRGADSREARATLSAALVLAHARTPLSTVIAEAHRLLDDVAKEGNGRDSLAVAVRKRGGLHCQWVTAWTRMIDGKPVPAVDRLGELRSRFRSEVAEPGLSSGLLYRIRETIALLGGQDRWLPGAWSELPAALDVKSFLRAEVVRCLGEAGSTAQGGSPIDEWTELLVDLVSPARGAGYRGGAGCREAGTDALLLAHFLAGSEYADDLESTGIDA